MENRIKYLYSDRLVTINEDETLLEADQLMDKHHIRHLPVLNRESELVGVLSRADYLALKKMKFNLINYKVNELMSAPVKVFAANARVRAVAQLFIAKKISCGLVLEDDEIVGIVTAEDLIRLLAESEELNDEAEKMDLAALADEGWISATSLM